MQQCAEMHAAGLIEPATDSRYASPGLLVPKYDEHGKPLPVDKWRLVGDFRRRNDRTETDHYTMPTDREIFRDVVGKVYTTLDLFKGYHQVRIAERDDRRRRFGVARSGGSMFECPWG